MRIESSVTSLSWIPLGAVDGSTAYRSGSASPITIRHHLRSSVLVDPPADGGSGAQSKVTTLASVCQPGM
jgi:hypothetical protein